MRYQVTREDANSVCPDGGKIYTSNELNLDWNDLDVHCKLEYLTGSRGRAGRLRLTPRIHAVHTSVRKRGTPRRKIEPHASWLIPKGVAHV